MPKMLPEVIISDIEFIFSKNEIIFIPAIYHPMHTIKELKESYGKDRDIIVLGEKHYQALRRLDEAEVLGNWPNGDVIFLGAEKNNCVKGINFTTRPFNEISIGIYAKVSKNMYFALVRKSECSKKFTAQSFKKHHGLD